MGTGITDLLFAATERFAETRSGLAELCLSVLALVASLKKGFFLAAEDLVHANLIVRTLGFMNTGKEMILGEPKILRELCILVSRLNRNVSYQSKDQTTVTLWTESVFALTISVLAAPAPTNELLSTASYLMDFWARLSYSRNYIRALMGARKYFLQVYREYVCLYGRAVETNEDVTTANEMTVLFREPLSTLGRVE